LTSIIIEVLAISASWAALALAVEDVSCFALFAILSVGKGIEVTKRALGNRAVLTSTVLVLVVLASRAALA